MLFSSSICASDDAHQWSDQDISLLQGLGLENLKPADNQSNRVTNNPEAITLGHKLFFDQRFSLNGEIACASCHQPDKYFTDALDTAQGLSKTSRNTPTIVGSSQASWLFHDGRADSLWSQALGPLENSLEHGGSRGQYAQVLYNDQDLRNSYEILFGKMPDISDNKRFPLHAGPVKDPQAQSAWNSMSNPDKETITYIFVNIGKAIATYESQLLPAPSRFDQYVKALNNEENNKLQEIFSQQEAKGLRIFIRKGNCILCHNGPMLTDSGFHNIATPARKGHSFDWGRYNGAKQLVSSPFNCRSKYNDDKDRQCNELEYMVLDKHETLGSIKTPSLRNVTKTAPYMHAGQYQSLREVLKHYNDPPPLSYRKNDLFLDIDLNEQELKQLEAFLHTLESPVAANSSLLTSPN